MKSQNCILNVLSLNITIVDSMTVAEVVVVVIVVIAAIVVEVVVVAAH